MQRALILDSSHKSAILKWHNLTKLLSITKYGYSYRAGIEPEITD